MIIVHMTFTILYFFIYQEADLAMGSITRTTTRDTAVDFSYPYFVTRVGFFTKKPSQVPNVKALLGPYGNIVWIALAVSVPAFSLIFFSFSKIDREGFATNFNPGKAIMQVSQMLVMQGMQIIKRCSWDKYNDFLFKRDNKVAHDLEKQDVIAILGNFCINYSSW